MVPFENKQTTINNDTQASSFEVEVNGGVEAVTKKNADGSIRSITERKVTPEVLAQEAYDRLHTGTCSICLAKDKAINRYNVCEDCENGSPDYSLAKVNLFSIFNTEHEKEIADYTRAILKATSESDMQLSAKRFVNFCLSCGIAGKVFIEDFVRAMTKQTKYNTKVEQTYRIAFAWWKK